MMRTPKIGRDDNYLVSIHHRDQYGLAGVSRFGSGGMQLNDRPTQQSGYGLPSGGDFENPTVNKMHPGGEKLRHKLDHNKTMEKSLNDIWPFHFVQPMHPDGKFAARCTFPSYTLPRTCQSAPCANPRPTEVSGSETTFTQLLNIRKGCTGSTPVLGTFAKHLLPAGLFQI